MHVSFRPHQVHGNGQQDPGAAPCRFGVGP